MDGLLSALNEPTRERPASPGMSARDASYRERVTVEVALYAGVLGVALFLRLFRLGLAPMSENEAAQALAALRGTFLPAGGSPFLYSINSFLFSLFSASDAMARLVPALVGSLVVLLPGFFRDALGRFGALGASVILAISPLALVASRSLSGEGVVVACVLVPIGLVRRYAATADPRNLIGAAVALGVGLASGSGMYTTLVALAASAIVLRFALGRESHADVEGRRLETPPTEMLPPLGWRALIDAPHRAGIAASLVIAFVIAATGGLARLAGLGAAGDLLAAWLNAFGAANGSSAFDVVQILLVYETLPVVVGVIGLARALAGADRFGAGLGFAAITSTAIIILQPGRQPIDLLLPVTLLALLAGFVIQPWAEAVKSKASLVADGVILAVGIAVVTFLTFQVSAFVRGRFLPTSIGGVVLPPEIMLVSLFVLLVGVIGALLALMYEIRTVLRAVATLGLIVLIFGSIGIGWGATQERVGDPREIVWGPSVTPIDVRDLVTTAEQIAVRAQGHTATLPIRVEVDDPVVAWYLRDARLPEGQVAAGVVTPFGAQPQPSEDRYIGARFNTRAAWNTLGLNVDTWLEWVLFRTSGADLPQATRTVTLWEKR